RGREPHRHDAHAQARRPLDARLRRRIDHPHRLPHRADRRGQRLHLLRHHEGRDPRAHPHGRRRIRVLWDQRDRRRSRLHRDTARHDDLRRSGRACSDRGPDPDGPSGHPGRRRGDHGVPRERRRRLRNRRAVPRRRWHDHAVNPAADTPAGGPASPGGAAHAPSSTGDGSAAEGRWAFGRWSLEVRGDELADVRCDGRVVLRAIRAVARDEDWATAWPRGATTRTEPDTLELHLRIADVGLDLAGTVHVAADGDRLVVDLDLEALTDSPTNRIGLVVLHPPQLAGTPLQVTHSEGAVEELSFPVQVSPHQPAKDIAGLAWEADRVSLRLDLAGDVFEMEDQRNWTDASFKTYSRPLDLPFPYTVSAGEHVRQQLVLTAVPSTDEAGAAPSGAGSTLTPSADGSPTARAGAPEELIWQSGGTGPAIGTGHLDLELADPDWSQRLDAALSARRSGDGAASSGGAAPSDTSLALWVVSSSPADPVVLAELGRRLAAAVRDGASFRFLGIADAARHVTTPDLAAALREVAAVPHAGDRAADRGGRHAAPSRRAAHGSCSRPAGARRPDHPAPALRECRDPPAAGARPGPAGRSARRHGAARDVDGRERGGARGPGDHLADLRAGARAAREARRRRVRCPDQCPRGHPGHRPFRRRPGAGDRGRRRPP